MAILSYYYLAMPGTANEHLPSETCPPTVSWEANDDETAFEALLRQIGPSTAHVITARWFRSLAGWMIMSTEGTAPPDGHWQKFTREGEQTFYGASSDESKGGGNFAIVCELWPEEWGPAPPPEQPAIVEPDFALGWEVAENMSPLEAMQELESGPAVIGVVFGPGGTGRIIEIDKRQAPAGHRLELQVNGQLFENARATLGQTATARLFVIPN